MVIRRTARPEVLVIEKEDITGKMQTFNECQVSAILSKSDV